MKTCSDYCEHVLVPERGGNGREVGVVRNGNADGNEDEGKKDGCLGEVTGSEALDWQFPKRKLNELQDSACSVLELEYCLAPASAHL